MPRSRRKLARRSCVLPRARISTTWPSRPRLRVAGAHGDAVAVPEHLHLARGEINVVAAVVGPEKAETVAMREHRARDEVEVAA